MKRIHVSNNCCGVFKSWQWTEAWWKEILLCDKLANKRVKVILYKCQGNLSIACKLPLQQSPKIYTGEKNRKVKVFKFWKKLGKSLEKVENKVWKKFWKQVLKKSFEKKFWKKGEDHGGYMRILAVIWGSWRLYGDPGGYMRIMAVILWILAVICGSWRLYVPG